MIQMSLNLIQLLLPPVNLHWGKPFEDRVSLKAQCTHSGAQLNMPGWMRGGNKQC